MIHLIGLEPSPGMSELHVLDETSPHNMNDTANNNSNEVPMGRMVIIAIKIMLHNNNRDDISVDSYG
jgi:hypothetical protein